MRGRSTFSLAIGVAAVALVAAGCTTTPAKTTTDDQSGGTLRIYASEPAFLVPTAADDDPSIQVIHQMYRGLVKYNDETGAPELDLAQSITSDDNTTWTITLKKGYKFTNGEPVDADSFIRAWNYAAYAPNAQNNAYFLSKIVGIENVSYGVDPDGDGPEKAPDPVSKTLSGLQKIDDYTFRVILNSPFSGFEAVVGYSGFDPVAQACLDNFDACNETPITNGPYKIDGKWNHDTEIKLVRNPDWTGDPGKSYSLDYKIYADVASAFDAFKAGELDVMYTIPSANVKEAQSASDYSFFQKPSNNFTYLGMPLYNDNFKDVRVRQAISLAIDRQAIIDSIFDGRFSVATGLVSPNFNGYRADVCSFCKYDPTQAKSLLEAAGGWKGGKLVLWANGGADHEKWLQAVGDQLHANLGIDYELNTTEPFAQYLDTAGNKGFTGPFRLGWGPDYPFIETYLAPLYTTNGSSNNFGYSNADFDAKIVQANAASNPDDAIKLYQDAEDIAAKDLPVLPMWFGKVSSVYASTIETFVWNTIASAPNYGEVVLKAA